jgi:hypothetical protein
MDRHLGYTLTSGETRGDYIAITRINETPKSNVPPKIPKNQQTKESPKTKGADDRKIVATSLCLV